MSSSSGCCSLTWQDINKLVISLPAIGLHKFFQQWVSQCAASKHQSWSVEPNNCIIIDEIWRIKAPLYPIWMVLIYQPGYAIWILHFDLTEMFIIQMGLDFQRHLYLQLWNHHIDCPSVCGRPTRQIKVSVTTWQTEVPGPVLRCFNPFSDKTS